jgi:iron complex transport system substrate-binding protein
MFPPQRIICLTEETVETLYLLGEQDRIAGITGYAVRPSRARREKPRVSAFTSADLPKILALHPDLVLTFSDLQAEIAASLIRAGIEVHAFNQRSIAGILDMIRTLGVLVDARDKAARLVEKLEANLAAAKQASQNLVRRLKVFFEEWDEPLISGIGWVAEVIEIAGGIDAFPGCSAAAAAKDRIVTMEEIVAQAPDIIIGSWCGRKFQPDKVVRRPGFDAIPAVRSGAIFEIKSPLILQPGPAALTDGLQAVEAIIGNWAKRGM